MGKSGRKPWYDQNGMKKGAWSQEEDEKLRSYIEKYGHWNWRQLPKFAGLSRCGKSCRLRWLNYLRQNIRRGNFSKEEEDLIISLRSAHGNKWAEIATRLPGRTDNEVKNYWHSKLKKRVNEGHQSSKQVMPSCEILPSDADTKVQPIEFGKFVHQQEEDLPINSTSTVFPSTSESYSQLSGSSSSGLPSLKFDYELLCDIMWFSDDSINSWESFSEPTENFWTETFVSENLHNENVSFIFRTA